MTTQSNLVAAAFEHPRDAEAAVSELGQAGFDKSQISLMYTDRSHTIKQGLIGGAVFGGVIGGLVGLLFPPAGALVAAGPVLGAIASALSGAGELAIAGAALNALTSGLIQLGMPREIAGRFGEHVHKGDTLLVVHATQDEAERARQILERHGPRTAEGAHAAAQPDQGAVVTSVVTPGSQGSATPS